MKTHRRFRIAGLVTLLPLSLSAQVSWTGSATPDSDWATAGNWSSTPAAPTAADDVIIDAGPATVTTTDAVARTLTVAQGGNSTGELTVSAGGVLTVSTQSILGYGAGSSGVATVTGAGAVWNTSDLVVGAFGQGALTISAGGVVNSANVDLASGPGTTQGTVLVTGAGSQWNSTAAAFAVGGYVDETRYNQASLTLADGGAVTVGAGGDGTLFLRNNGVVRIGLEGTAGLGGTLTAGEIAFDDSGYIDHATTPNAEIPTLAFNHTDAVEFTARLSGAGLVTKAGSGTLTLTGNGVADANDVSAFDGYLEVSGGTLVIDVDGYWDGTNDFEITGSTLRIAAGTTLANNLVVDGGTVEIAGTLEGAYFNHGFTDATLHVLSGGAITDDVITLQGTSSLTLDSTGGLIDSELNLLGATSLTLGADEALVGTLVQLAPDDSDPDLVPEINLNGHDVTFAALYASAGRIINNSAIDVTVTIGEACGCGGGLSLFLGTFVEQSGGQIGLNIVGGNALVLSGTQTYTGPTLVDGSVYPSALFVINAFEPGVLTSSPVTLRDGGFLGGDGTVNSVTIQGGGTLSPGDYGSGPAGAVGKLSTGPITIENDPDAAEPSFLHIDIYDADDALAPGLGVDFLNIVGDFTFSDGLDDTFTVNVGSIGDSDDLALNFDPAANHTWKIAATSFGGSIVNFDPSRIFVDASLFTNAPGLWTLTLGNGNTELLLNYAPIPEPATFALLGSLAVLPALLRRRRPRA